MPGGTARIAKALEKGQTRFEEEHAERAPEPVAEPVAEPPHTALLTGNAQLAQAPEEPDAECMCSKCKYSQSAIMWGIIRANGSKMDQHSADIAKAEAKRIMRERGRRCDSANPANRAPAGHSARLLYLLHHDRRFKTRKVESGEERECLM